MRVVVFLALLCTQAIAEFAPFDPDIPRVTLRLLASGQQADAEAKLEAAVEQNRNDPRLAFWSGVLERSRFSVDSAAPAFLYAARQLPNAAEGQAAACILGIDFAADLRSALYYYNTLLAVAWQNPESVPVHWLVGIATRTLTREDKGYTFTYETLRRILLCGVREYETALALLQPGPGPALMHETLANLLDDLQAYETSLQHRQTCLSMERKHWSLQTAAWTLSRLGRNAEALPLIREAVERSPETERHHFTMAEILWNLGQHEEALRAGAKAAELYPFYRYFDFCAKGHRFLGNYAASREFSKRLLAIYPNDWNHQIWDARLAVLLNEPGAGERVLEVGSFDFKGNAIKAPAPEKDPWFLAAQKGDVEGVRRLLHSGGDINRLTETDKQTALMIAIRHGWEPIVRLLIQSGADLNVVDVNNDTALHYSADFTQPRMMKLLLDAGAKTDLQDRWHQTPLIMCADARSWDGFRLLLQRNASVKLATPHGGSPLHYACSWGDLPMMKALLQAGADVNARCAGTGRTPLMDAARSEWSHPHVIIPLLNAGADLNLRDPKDGRTALHLAIDPLMNKPLVELLLEKGADPSIPDNFGVTPITQARLLGFEETAQAMEKKVGRQEPLHFPRFEIQGETISKDEKNAASYVFPVLLGEGHPLGRPSAVPPGDKKAARAELSRMFGITKAEELNQELQALEAFEPRLRSNALHEELGEQGDLLKKIAADMHVAVRSGSDETAWTRAHMIYLSDLGVSAEFLNQEEGTKRIVQASRDISSCFGSWEEYLRSFQLGARLHKAWDSERYEHICAQIQAAKILWP